jgi:hypothetical protein
MVENEKINKNGLTMVYTLDEFNHRNMNEHLFYKSNPSTDKFIPSDEFEVVIGGILIKFNKK